MKKKGQITITECLSADPFLLIYSTMNVPTPLIPTKFIEDSSINLVESSDVITFIVLKVIREVK